MLGVCPATVRKWCRDGKVNSTKTPNGYQCLYPAQIEKLRLETPSRYLNIRHNIPTCHPEKPYYCNDLCKPCYDKTIRDKPENKARSKIYQREYYLAHPDKKKTYNKVTKRETHVKRYGITLEWYYDKLDKGCGLCGTLDWGGYGPCIDHDHSHCDNTRFGCAECVRGVLCNKCNRSLGFLNDDTTLLAKGILYCTENDTNKLQNVVNFLGSELTKRKSTLQLNPN